MCIADMVKKIVNDWADADFADTNAAGAREFPKAMDWEISYAVDIAQGLRQELAKGERIMCLRFVEDPSHRAMIKMPAGKIDFLTYARAAPYVQVYHRRWSSMSGSPVTEKEHVVIQMQFFSIALFATEYTNGVVAPQFDLKDIATALPLDDGNSRRTLSSQLCRGIRITKIVIDAASIFSSTTTSPHRYRPVAAIHPAIARGDGTVVHRAPRGTPA
jgi:hypothetical protein